YTTLSRSGLLRPRASGLVVLTGQLRGLVEQGDVRGCPRRALRAHEQLALGAAELGRSSLEPVRLREEVLEEALRGQRHPREVQRDPHLARRAEVFHDVAALVRRDG